VPGIAVPGNHDHYTHSTVLARGFEDAFGPWMDGRRVGDYPFPFARELAGTWFIGVNSCVPNLLAWDARGSVGANQLARLDELLGALPAGRRVLVTHYPYVNEGGLAEHGWHGLRDREALGAVMAKHGVKVWLCGHRHRPYHFGPTMEVPFLVHCSGSGTQSGLASISELVIGDDEVTIRRIVYTAASDAWVAGESVTVSLN
jgi:3',5'-cyclic AMP phosphodiesterase CpdA